MANLLDAIGIVQVANVNPKTNVLDNAFTTFDYVYIQSQGDALASHPLTVQATDYAKACGAHTIFTTSKPTNKNSQKILRDPLKPETLAIADENNNIISVEPYTEDFCVQPVICLSTNKMQSLNLNLHTIEENGKHYIYFGAFPQSRVKDSKYAKYLDKMQKKGKLVGLNKTFQTHKVYAFEDYNKPNAKDTNQYIQVRVKHNGGKYFNDGEQMPYDFTNIWVKVEPIKWEITNWDNLPTFINPKGNGTENFVQLATEKGLISGIQYTSGSNYVNGVYNWETSWQNSPVRAYLNGYDIQKILANNNGNPAFPPYKNISYNRMGFLKEAFGTYLENTYNPKPNATQQNQSQTKQNTASQNKQTSQNNQTGQNKQTSQNNQSSSFSQKKQEKQNKRTKLTTIDLINPDTSSFSEREDLTYTELIKLWIENGQSVLLRGPSGIGKTDRLRTMFPNIIDLKLADNMFPEVVLGSINFQEGQQIPPNFAREAILQCATQEERELVEQNLSRLYDIADLVYERSKNSNEKVVILLDELLNVKPAVQALVYNIVLNKVVESSGKSLKLPANTVVVATGNQQKYSAVSHDLAEPLEKRFDHIVDLEPRVDDWLKDYAIPKKVHPAVIAFIVSKYYENGCSNAIEDIGYFYEEPEVGLKNIDKNGCRGRTNDPRGWVAVSNSIKQFEANLKDGKLKNKNVEQIFEETIKTKLRSEWAEEFIDFYNIPTPTPHQILTGDYPIGLFAPGTINEKFIHAAKLLLATKEEVGACREYIRTYCGAEYLKNYDLMWPGNDEDKALIIYDLQQKDKLNRSASNGTKTKIEFDFTNK